MFTFEISINEENDNSAMFLDLRVYPLLLRLLSEPTNRLPASLDDALSIVVNLISFSIRHGRRVTAKQAMNDNVYIHKLCADCRRFKIKLK